MKIIDWKGLTESLINLLCITGVLTAIGGFVLAITRIPNTDTYRLATVLLGVGFIAMIVQVVLIAISCVMFCIYQKNKEDSED